MAVFTRRNALLGWSYWQSKRIKRRMRKARPVDRRRQSKSLIALAAASLAGAMAFKRRRRRSDTDRHE